MEDIQQTTHDHGKKPKGGLITMPFIFANESCERLAMAGFQTNMISYLTQQLHMPMTKAANTLTNFGGTSSLTPLLGAFIADSFAGRFWTITVASIIYQIVSFPSFMQVLLIAGSKPGKRICLGNRLKGFRVDMDHLKNISWFGSKWVMTKMDLSRTKWFKKKKKKKKKLYKMG
ncbi:putative proton-dependent oligopeptide transporter family, MFS transporter superfamily [Helianthus debilis subsp. tardiflorus]